MKKDIKSNSHLAPVNFWFFQKKYMLIIFLEAQ